MDRQTPVKSVVAVLAVSAGAGCALAWTVSQPDRHPLMFAFSLSWFIMMCAGAVTCQVFFRLDPHRFRLARWERNGRVYERAGVDAFRWLLLHTPLGWFGAQMTLRSGRSDLERLLRHMNSTEGSHTVAAGASLAAAAMYALTNHPAIATWLLLIIVPFHVYPAMVQRWNRGRVLQLQQRLPAVKSTGKEPRPDQAGDQA